MFSAEGLLGREVELWHRFPNLCGSEEFDIDHDYDHDIGRPVRPSSLP